MTRKDDPVKRVRAVLFSTRGISMTGEQQPDPNRSTVEQLRSQSVPEKAAEWFERLRTGDLSTPERYEYVRWLKESPRHVAESLRLLRLHAGLRKNRGILDPTFDVERVNLEQAWDVIRSAGDRDLVLWAEDSVPSAQRIQQAIGLALPVPESTLKLMASHERERRSKRRERVWWLVALVAGVVLSPIVVELIEGLVSAK
jgi:ferric-dicitrate binding protein FerR (iron transport regulator)